MSKEERIQEITATVERIRQAHGIIVFDREDGQGMDVILRDCGLCIDRKELTKACGILWVALVAAETKLEPQTAKILEALPELLADYAEVATVAEPIDWRQYAIGLDNAYTSWDSEARALAQQAQDEDAATDFMVGKITEWLKSFVQRIHSSVQHGDLRTRVGLFMLKRGVKMGRAVDPADVQDMITEFASHSPVPDTKLLVDALEEVVRQTQHRGGDTYRTASSALTSYRERK